MTLPLHSATIARTSAAGSAAALRCNARILEMLRDRLRHGQPLDEALLGFGIQPNSRTGGLYRDALIPDA